ncbi:MAG: hypothetical protein JWO83_2573 [Caulobacteraceae bacterium]|jgi:uncharacterized protein|nr:hypothetical protein [Caulobacteraceae bacterium]
MRQPPSIDSFGAGGFRVSGVWRPGSLLLLDDAPLPWRPPALSDVTVEDFAPVIQAGPAISEFVLLGTGPTQMLPPREVRDALRAAGLGLEFMSTEAAARTYGVLVSEGRRVAVALIAV